MRHSYRQEWRHTYTCILSYFYINAKAIIGEYLKEALAHGSCLNVDTTAVSWNKTSDWQGKLSAWRQGSLSKEFRDLSQVRSFVTLQWYYGSISPLDNDWTGKILEDCFKQELWTSQCRMRHHSNEPDILHPREERKELVWSTVTSAKFLHNGTGSCVCKHNRVQMSNAYFVFVLKFHRLNLNLRIHSNEAFVQQKNNAPNKLIGGQ